MQKEILTGIIITSAIILIVSVLLQKKDGGLGATFGGSSGAYMKKRGAEKAIFFLTIISAIVFCGTIMVSLILK